MGDVVEFRSRKQRAVTRIHTAAEDIEAVIVSGCMHEAVEWMSVSPSMKWLRCRICKKVLNDMPPGAVPFDPETCMHERIAWIGSPGMQYERCCDCHKVLRKIP